MRHIGLGAVLCCVCIIKSESVLQVVSTCPLSGTAKERHRVLALLQGASQKSGAISKLFSNIIQGLRRDTTVIISDDTVVDLLIRSAHAVRIPATELLASTAGFSSATPGLEGRHPNNQATEAVLSTLFEQSLLYQRKRKRSNSV